MSPLGGLLFLAAGIAVFALGIFVLIAVERSSRKPRRTVAGFQRSRRALRRIFRAHIALREAARARARASHPARRKRSPIRGRRSA